MSRSGAALALIGLLISLVFSTAGARASHPGEASPSGRNDDLIVLAYHEITTPDQAVMPDYAVTPTAFTDQLAWLERHGHHFVSLEQVLRARNGRSALPSRPVLLTFDDGYRSVYTAAYPLLKRHNAPAVLALVGHWLEPTSGLVPFGDGQLERSRLLSWDQLREMQASGLVEMASHTYDLHRGITGNPQRNSMAAVTTRLITPDQGYEAESAYRQRLWNDLRANSDLLQQRLGRRPRAVAWPYGRYNVSAESIARSLGMPVGLTLDDGSNAPSLPLSRLRRVLMTAEMAGTRGLVEELQARERNWGDNSRAAKVMHVDLDNIDDPDSAQVERNLRLLLQRIQAMGVNTVYLQAYADPDGNGAANALYFANRHLPVKRDLFSHVAWEIRTRTPVKRLYAWMPVLAFELPQGTPGADQRVVTQPSKSGHLTMGYPRLSPFSSAAMETVREIYADLGRHATFDGILFHDDVTLSDYEDASPAALRQYKAWGLPTDLASIRASDSLMDRWTQRKTETLDRLTLHLADTLRADQPQLRTARNIYAQVVLNPHAESWYSQSLDHALDNYDFTAVMAMPYMEKAADPQQFFQTLVGKVKDHPGAMERVLFEIQSTDWASHRDLDSQQMARQLQELYQLGVRHTGYYPDNFHRGTPDPDSLRPVFQAQSSAPQPS